MRTLIFIVCTIFTLNVFAEKLSYYGTVHDAYGIPLVGVNVMVKGAKSGTHTDFDGNFEIESKIGNTLVFTSIGYKTLELQLEKISKLDIILKEEVSDLEEIVITTQCFKREKKALGYAVSQATLSQSTSKNSNSISRVLSGKHSGVKITSQNGTTGSATNVLIRGVTSINGASQPLFVINGVAYDGSQLHQFNVANIDSNSIKNVTILKGDKAAELYGTAGKNGVVVITTKNGKINLEQLVSSQDSYAEIKENDFESTIIHPLSTFSIDVDKASYSNIRRMINKGQKIPKDAVKIEEMINYFDYDYPQPTNEHPFAIHNELIHTPWNTSTKLVKIGIQGKTYKNEDLPPSNLTFLIDVSGSMNASNKLGLLKSAFKLLVHQLRSIDKVSIVVYAGAAGVILKPTSGDNKEKILNALQYLEAGGSTAGGEGIELAYKLAQQHFIKNGNNRVILATDGDFNVGASSNKAMENLIIEKRKSGVFLSVLGFGYGNYKDSKLEILADKGNGNHAYIDTMQEAQRVFGQEFGGTLYTIAKDVKIQVEFNPAKVQAYRLIGYENRLLEDEDFIDDTKDAGELGSGHNVTALYEIIPAGIKHEFFKDTNNLKYTHTTPSENYSDELLTVKFRYKHPNATKSIEITHVVNDTVSASVSVDMSFASAVALFGMKLRDSKYHNQATIKDILSLAENGRGKDLKGYRAEFVRLVEATQ
ncbi:MAG: von Willebrand factor type A domain-containing protein [Flavobacteriaceae bacterium]|nr:von Willebrand factor type A domain-containing protein [Flavobacteriaceae bacterium]